MTETARLAASSPAATTTPPALPARSASARNGALLVSFTAVTNLADGVTKVALPLLATHLTRSPALVACVMLTLTVPWLFAALHVGVLVDRADRRRLISVANALRLGTIAALAALVPMKALALPELYGAGLALGIAEVIALTAGSALIQTVAVPDNRDRVNSWVTAAETVCNEFAGPPIGGLLIGIGAAVALGATAAAYALGIVLVAALAGNFRVRREPVAADQTATITAEIRAGVSYLWSQRLLRTMCLMIAMMAGCWSAWLAILPSYATGPMHLSPGEYGLLLSALGVGGVVGAFSTRIVNRWLGRRWALFADLAGTFSMMCVPAVTTSPWLVGLAAFAGGVGGTLWTVNSRTISQLVVPAEMMGRFSAVARLLGWGTMPLGAAVAGGLAQAFGIRIAFAAGAVGMALLVIPFLRIITPSALAAANPPRPGDT